MAERRPSGLRRGRIAMVAAAGLSLLAAASCGAAEPANMRATMSDPAAMTVKAPPGGGQHRLVITVSGYTPPAPGQSVDFVVVAGAPGREQILGRFGVMPAMAFQATDPTQMQRFGFALPAGLARQGAIPVRVKIEARHGDGRGASLVVGDAAIE